MTKTQKSKRKPMIPVVISVLIMVLIIISGVCIQEYTSTALVGEKYQLSKDQEDFASGREETQYVLNHMPSDKELRRTNKVPSSYEETDFYMFPLDAFSPNVEIEKLNYTLKPADLAFQKTIDDAAFDVCSYINKKYDKSWSYKSVPVGFYKDKKSYTMASFYPDENVFAFNNNGLYDLAATNTVARYTTSHESGHALMFQNLGDVMCPLYDGKGNSVGIYLHEGIVDKIAYDYLESKGLYPLQIRPDYVPVIDPQLEIDLPDELKESIQISTIMVSDYELLVFNIECFDMLFGVDLIEAVINNDLESAENAINTFCNDDKAFVRWLNLFDAIGSSAKNGKPEEMYYHQGILSQFYNYVLERISSSKLNREYVKLSNYYILRTYFIKVDVKTPLKAICAWYYLNEELIHSDSN